MRKSILLTSFIALLIISCTPTYMVVFSGSQGGSVSTPGGEFDEGSTVSVTAQPDAEYEFERWSDGSTQSTRTLTVLEALNLTAYFVKKQYEFTVNVQGEGTVKQDVIVQGSKINSGTELRLTASPSDNWEFSNWIGDVESTDNPIIVKIDGTKAITAIFKRQNPIILDDNGVTLKVKEFAQVGEIWNYNGIDYLIVNESMLREMVANNQDVSKVITTFVDDMSNLFLNNRDFNLDIGAWDVANVKNMSGMFRGAITFNTPIDKWNTSNVTNMSSMFKGANQFNQDISEWDLSQVFSTFEMFFGAFRFNQDISSWDVGNVIDMGEMFGATIDFNQDIGGWNVSNAQSMKAMFAVANSFNQDISNWDVSKVTNMAGMFIETKAFNQDLSNWNVNMVTYCLNFASYTPEWILPKPNFLYCEQD